MAGLPQDLQAQVSRVLGARPGSVAAGAAALTETYRHGGTSRGIDLTAYLAARLPATYAATSTVLGEVRRLLPGFSPASVLDAGSGPGTASWAAVEQWDSIGKITFLDDNAAFLALAADLASGAEHPALKGASRLQQSLTSAAALPQADLVIAAYALAEIPQAAQANAVQQLWASAAALVLVEPGTPAGAARLLAAREVLKAAGAHLAGPCPHEEACPLRAPGWCHFSVRLPRARAHLHAKQARVPFEDEKFAWLAVTRHAIDRPSARVIGHPRESKAEIALPLCTAQGLEQRRIPRRERAAYAAARRLDWGDAV